MNNTAYIFEATPATKIGGASFKVNNQKVTKDKFISLYKSILGFDIDFDESFLNPPKLPTGFSP